MKLLLDREGMSDYCVPDISRHNVAYLMPVKASDMKHWGNTRRDTQQALVYRAEASVKDVRGARAGVAGSLSREQCTQFVQKVIDDTTFQFRYGLRFCDITYSRSLVAPAEGGGITMHIPLWARHRHVLLHELAHCIVSQSTNLVGHCALWASTYLWLIGNYISMAAMKRMRKAFNKHGVRYNARKA